MDLRQLRHFVALVDHRSFVKAADAVGITQPAFSRSIRGLEEEFGCQLIDRGSKDLRPTPEGHVVFRHAQELVRGASNLTHEVRRMGKLDAGELSFGCGPVPAGRLVPEALARFVGDYPGVQVRFAVNNWTQLSRQLARDEIEFFVADIRHFVGDPQFQTLALTPREGLFFCRPGHPLLTLPQVTSRELLAHPLASVHLPAETRKALARNSGVLEIRPAIECDHLPALELIVRSSDAVGLGAVEALQPALQAGTLVALSVADLPGDLAGRTAQCGIVSRTGYRLSAAARAMIQLLCEQDRQLQPDVAA